MDYRLTIKQTIGIALGSALLATIMFVVVATIALATIRYLDVNNLQIAGKTFAVVFAAMFLASIPIVNRYLD